MQVSETLILAKANSTLNMDVIYGIIGDPIEHSLSPAMHNAAYESLGLSDHCYLAFHVKPEDLQEALARAKALGIRGLNVTIPHKEAVTRLVDLDANARRIGAVNTVDIMNMKGYNTDGSGAVCALEEAGVSVRGKSVLVMGAGGAARAIAFALNDRGADLHIVNRTPERARLLAEGVADDVGWNSINKLEQYAGNSDIIINTTPVGMHPHVDESLITSNMMHEGQIVFDIVYNPVETRLLKEAKKAGAITIDGVKMLVYQGVKAFTVFTGIDPPADVMEGAVRARLGGEQL